MLLDAVHEERLRQTRGFEDGGREVNDVVKLRAVFPLRFDALRPVHDHAVPRAAPVRRHLLGPLIGCVHRVRPADGVVIVGFRPAQLVQSRDEEFGRFERFGTVEVDHLVEGAAERALGRCAVVTDDVEHQRIVQQPQLLDRVEQPAHVVVHVLHVPGVHLHLPAQDGLEILRHRVPRGDLRVANGEVAVGRNDAELFLAGEGFFSSVSQPWSNCPLYLSAHSLGTWWGACVAPGAKYTKNGLSGSSAFC